MRKVDILDLPEPYPTTCYCWGSGSGGAIGINKDGSIRKISLKPCEVKIPTSSPILIIAASTSRTIVKTYSGVCYSWGKPPLGRRTTSLVSEAKPRKIDLDQNVEIEKIIHGETHTVLLTKNGSILSFGDSSSGKLGHRNKSRGIVTIPTKASLRKKCINVVCGFTSTILLVDDGSECLVWGQNGFTSKMLKQNVPQSYSFPVKIVDVSSGMNHVAAVSSEGSCFTWGLSENGRLGHGGDESEVDYLVDKPQRVNFFNDNRILALKVNCGGAHTIIVDNNGIIFSFGWNEHFQCGLKTNQDISIPTKVNTQSSKIIDVSCGFAHTIAIDISGDLFVWGFNEDGQLGLGHESSVNEPTLLDFKDSSYTIAISAGKTHTACVRAPCSLDTFTQRINEICIKRNAISILRRFCSELRCSSRRPKTLGEINTATNIDIKEESITHDRDLDSKSIHDSVSSFDTITSTTSYSDSEIDHTSTHTHDIAYIHNNENNERKLMRIEDDLSEFLVRMEKKRFIKVRGGRKRIVQELMRRNDLFCMAREDRFSNALQKEYIEKLQEQKHPVNKEQISMRIAKPIGRKKQYEDAKLKQIQPSLRKRTPKSKSIHRSTSYRLHRSTNSCKQERRENIESIASLWSSSEYNRKLLRRRDSRLLRQEKAKLEFKKRMSQEDKLQKINEAVQLKRKKDVLLRIVENVDVIMIKQKIERESELAEINKHLTPTKSFDKTPDNIENSHIRSVSDWSRELL